MIINCEEMCRLQDFKYLFCCETFIIIKKKIIINNFPRRMNKRKTNIE